MKLSFNANQVNLQPKTQKAEFKTKNQQVTSELPKIKEPLQKDTVCFTGPLSQCR